MAQQVTKLFLNGHEMKATTREPDFSGCPHLRNGSLGLMVCVSETRGFSSLKTIKSQPDQKMAWLNPAREPDGLHPRCHSFKGQSVPHSKEKQWSEEQGTRNAQTGKCIAVHHL